LRLSRWDAYSLSLIILFSVLVLLNFFEFPLSLDIYYHLGVAQEFNHAGGFSAVNYSEFAPMGRVQLYPPLFQILTAFILKTGLSPIVTAKLLNFLIYPVFLFVFWFLLKRLLGDKQSFFSLFLLSLPYSLFISCVDNIPATMAIMLVLGSLLMIENKRTLSSSVLLGLAFYAHFAFGCFGLVTILVYGFLKKERLKRILTALSGALIIASVFIIHVVKNASLLTMGSQRDPLEIPWLIYLLFIISMIIILKNKIYDKYLFWITYALLSFVIFFTYPFRFFSGQGIIPFVVLGSISLSKGYDLFENSVKNLFPHKAMKIFIFFIIFNFLWPLLAVDVYITKKNYHVLGDSTFRQLTRTIDDQPFRLHDVSLYSRFANELSEIIKDNSNENEIMFCNMGIFGQLLSVISDRANASGMLSEVTPRLETNPLHTSKVFIALKNEDATRDPQADLAARKFGFKEITETDIAVVYKMQGQEIIRSQAKAQIKFFPIALFLCALIAIIIFEPKFIK